jgi:hypothetical protein
MSRALYLGRQVDPRRGTLGARLDLDPADLLTHGLIVGMTGSGKTGLAIVLIEELLRLGIPVLAIDPKGDLGNLLLQFSSLDADSFEPWVDPEAARRDGLDIKAAAREAAAAWTKGLTEWGLGAADIASLAKTHEAMIYTPGSKSGIPLDVLQSLEAPSVPFDSAEEDLRDEIWGIVAGLLGLLKVEADPLQSREAILLANLIEGGWRTGKGFSLQGLVGAVADPPFDTLGALPLESAFPRKERQALMMGLNNLLASPSFAAWREGEPLDVERLLHAPDGRPRLSIVYTAHLSDEERLFVTALLLDKVKTWMCGQSGTTELRALVYMDEIFGYFPPHPANPPTKRPLLTLLKQARAQGVGVVLATQNPVDLDYKGLANMGAWMVGTLQTRQDRDRLRDGLTSAGLDSSAVEDLLAATKKRVFLLHDVHRDGPSLLQSRWAMSYLRGPLTREEIARLMKGKAAPTPAGAAPRPPSAAGAGERPILPPPFEHLYVALYGGEIAEAHVLAKYAVRFKDAGESVGIRLYPLAGASAADALEAEPLAVEEKAISTEAPTRLRYGSLPEWLAEGGARAVEKALRERLPDKLAITVLRDPVTGLVSNPGEAREAFVTRLQALGGGDAGEKLHQRLEKRRAELAVREEELQGRKQEKWLALGSAVLRNIGLFTGRKRTISGAGAVLSKNRLENTAEARAEALRAEVAELERQVAETVSVDPARLHAQAQAPARGGVKLLRCDLVWVY